MTVYSITKEQKEKYKQTFLGYIKDYPNEFTTDFIREVISDFNALKSVIDESILEFNKTSTKSDFNALIEHVYDKLKHNSDFYCGVMVSIAGFMSSPFFSVYGASKAALKIFIESVNVELEKSGTTNRILNVSPGSIKGTSFNQGKTDLQQTKQLASEIIAHLNNKDDL